MKNSFKAYLLLISAVFIVSGSYSQVCFRESTYETKDGIFSALSADYNGDGNMDIAVTCDREGTVHFLFGNGDGTFTKTSYTGYNKAQYTAFGDFNKDGDADLVVSREQYVSVAVFFGNNIVNNLNLNFVPYNVLVADFTNDTNDDILILDKWVAGGGSAVNIFPGQGSYTFGTTIRVLFPSIIYNIVAADFDNDSKIDLAVNDSIHWGQGNGTFSGSTSTVSVNAGSLISLDVNGDGITDLAGMESDSIVILMGNGDRTFQNPKRFSFKGTGHMKAGDMDGDTNLDLLIVSDAHIMHVYKGNGSGDFNFSGKYIWGDNIVSFTLGDFNNDSRKDIAVGLRGTNETKVLLNTSVLAPPVISNPEPGYCKDAISDVLSATGTNVRWSYNTKPVTIWNFGVAEAPSPQTFFAGTDFYYADQTLDNCRSAVAEAKVTIHSIPVVTAEAVPDYCTDDAPVGLFFGLPEGGTYSGNYVNEGQFDPAVAGEGSHQIIYTYTDGNGCSGSVEKEVNVTECLSLSKVNEQQANASIYTSMDGNSVLIEQSENFREGVVRIFDISGHLIAEEPVGDRKMRMDISRLDKGFYLICFAGTNFKQTGKIVKE